MVWAAMLLAALSIAFSLPALGAFSISAPPLLPPEHFGEYLAPNEGDTWGQAPLLGSGQGGVYVTVGTFRAWEGAVRARADELVVIDTDPAVHEFHRIAAQLIARSPSPAEFTRYIDCAIDPAMCPQDVPQEWLGLMGKPSRTIYTGPISAGAAFERRLDHLWEDAPQWFRLGMLGDAKLYDGVRSLLARGAVTNVGASVTDEPVFQSLAWQMKERQLKLRVLDLSNVHGFLDRGGGSKDAIRLALNAALLPAEKGALVLFSMGGFKQHFSHLAHDVRGTDGFRRGWLGVNDKDWTYLALSLEEYLQIARSQNYDWFDIPEYLKKEGMLMNASGHPFDPLVAAGVTEAGPLVVSKALACLRILSP